MEIENKDRGGERTNLNALTLPRILDLSEVISKEFFSRVDTLIDPEIKIEYNFLNTTNFLHPVANSIGMAYSTKFYPLDKQVLSEEDINHLKLLAISGKIQQYSYLDHLIDAHVNTFFANVIKAKSSKVQAYFSPADTFYYAGTIALGLYTFIVKESEDEYTIQTESSYLVVPEGKELENY